MRRLMLLAIGLSAILWTASARTGTVPADDIITMGAGSCLLSGDSHGPGDSDQQWRAQHHTVAAVTESLWKSALAKAALTPATTLSTLTFDPARAASSPDPPVRSAPHYLRHTPLLI